MWQFAVHFIVHRLIDAELQVNFSGSSAAGIMWPVHKNVR